MLAAQFSQHPSFSTGSPSWLTYPVPSVNSPAQGVGCPFPRWNSPYNSPFWLPGLSFSSALYSLGPGHPTWLVAPFSSPVCPSPSHTWSSPFWLCSPWSLPDVPASNCALHFICNKSPFPYLGIVMASPLSFSFTISLVFLVTFKISTCAKYKFQTKQEANPVAPSLCLRQPFKSLVSAPLSPPHL